MQCTVMTTTALAGILALASGAMASPVQAAPAAAVKDRTAWMFKYCTESDLGGKCAQKSDDGNLSVCGKFLPSLPSLKVRPRPWLSNHRQCCYSLITYH